MTQRAEGLLYLFCFVGLTVIIWHRIAWNLQVLLMQWHCTAKKNDDNFVYLIINLYLREIRATVMLRDVR